MTRLTIAFILFVTILNESVAQKEDLTWIFGDSGTGMRFTNGTFQVTPITGYFTPYSREGSTVVSNPRTGALVIYTDGMRVIDATNRPMLNGSDLLGNETSSQSGLVCTRPSSCSQYYIFYNNRVAHEFTGGELFYSTVDMDLPGNGSSASPLGAVTSQKNVLIAQDAAEAMELISDAERNRYWLLSPEAYGDGIRIFRIDETGIVLQSTYHTGFTLSAARSVRYSHSNQKIVLISSLDNDVALLVDFDISTGKFSDPTVIPGTPFDPLSTMINGIYDAEWSPDGSKLYLSRFRAGQFSGGKLYQYDLNTPLAAVELVRNVSNDPFYHSSGLRRGPDNKIYHLYVNASTNDKRIIGVINSPNQKGLACNYNSNAINLAFPINGAHKFPESVRFLSLDFFSPPEARDILDDKYSVCSGSSVTLDAHVGEAEYLWSNGSTSSSITVNQSGRYVVEITSSCKRWRDSTEVVINELPVVTLGNDTTLCQGMTLELVPVTNSGNFEWSTSATTKTISVTQSGTYSVTVSNQCGFAFDEVKVQFEPLDIMLSFADSLTRCLGELVVLDAFNDQATYLWSNGATGYSLGVSQTGLYYVDVSKGCGTLRDSIFVKFVAPPFVELGPDTALCVGESHAISAPRQEASYEWSTGSTSSKIQVDQSGTYSITVTNVCGTAQDSIEIDFFSFDKLAVPNVITPNGDRDNEYFTVPEFARKSGLEVFNRWGKQVYATSNYANNWNGGDLDAGVYYFVYKSPCGGGHIKSYLHILK